MLSASEEIGLSAEQAGDVDSWKIGSVRVLVAEDDSDLRNAVREALLMKGFVVNSASDGAKAAVLAALEEYDVIISDVRMPGMSGIDLARSVRSVARPPYVILMTAYPEWYHRANHAEVGLVLRKPVSLARLAYLVENAARRRSDEADAP